jgi:hypothetical protein
LGSLLAQRVHSRAAEGAKCGWCYNLGVSTAPGLATA